MIPPTVPTCNSARLNKPLSALIESELWDHYNRLFVLQNIDIIRIILLFRYLLDTTMKFCGDLDYGSPFPTWCTWSTGCMSCYEISFPNRFTFWSWLIEHNYFLSQRKMDRNLDGFKYEILITLFFSTWWKKQFWSGNDHFNQFWTVYK